MRKAVISLVVLFTLSFIGWRIVQKIRGGDGTNQRGKLQTVSVKVAEVRKESIWKRSEFTGTLEPMTQFDVAPKIQGRIERLLVDLGDSVANGQLIAELDDEEYLQQVEQARAELEVTKANLSEVSSALVVAARDYERVKQLREQKVAAIAELEEAENLHNAAKARQAVAQAQIRQKEAALRSAEVRLSYTSIKASWEDEDGSMVVAERFVDEGAMLRANDPIVSLVQTKALTGVIYIVERDFPLLRAGQEATITTDAYPGKTFTGTVTRRSPVLRENSRQARVEIEVPNPDDTLAPGMFVKIRINLEHHQNATVVPSTAVIRRNGDIGVFLANLSENTAKFVPVQVGIETEELMEILEPALTGVVVTLGHHLLEDDAQIAVVEDDQPESSVSKTDGSSGPETGATGERP